jgi:methionine-rich copper-binding protein CopC
MAHRFPYRRPLGAVLAALALSLTSVGLASAHASLVSANIKPGQVFAHNAYPHTLTAVFAENVNPQGSWVHVFEGDPAGDHGLVDRNNVRFPVQNPKEITVGLPSNLKGTYTVLWFTQSADDGHEAGNSFAFTVG